MAKVSLENLVRHNGRLTWFAEVRVPADVRSRIGRSVFRQTTGERDAARAAVRAQPLIAQWKAQIAAARGDDDTTLRAATLAATTGGRPRSSEGRKVLLATVGLSLEPFTASLETWKLALGAQGIKDRQVHQYTTDLALFAPEGKDLDLEAVTTARVQGWIDGRLKAGDSVKTIRRRLGALRNYWGHLQDIKKVSRDARSPFDPADLRLPKKPKAGFVGTVKREAFKLADVVRLYQATPDPVLKDLIAMAAYTGGRIEELASLQSGDVDTNEWTIRLDSKTEAGCRDVPVVASLRPIIARLVSEASTRGEYLIPSASCNKYEERGTALGHKFSKLKTKLGYKAGHVFHSIRKTVATQLHDAGCPEAIAADILGHRLQGMSYGVYSSGSSIRSRAEWMEKALQYPEGFP